MRSILHLEQFRTNPKSLAQLFQKLHKHNGDVNGGCCETMTFFVFLVACTRLYKPLYWLIGWSVCPSVRPSVRQPLIMRSMRRRGVNTGKPPRSKKF